VNQVENYAHSASKSSHVYDFRKDFSALAKPGLARLMQAQGYEPDEPEPLDDCAQSAKSYLVELFSCLRRVQDDFRDYEAWRVRDESPDCVPFHECVPSADADLYGVKEWSREGAQSYIDQRLEDILTSYPAEDRPVDIHRAMYLGAQLARKHGVDVSEGALAYAEARLASKIRRDAIYNPITEVHGAIVTHNQLKAARGGNVVYIDHYLPKREAPEQEAKAEAPKQEAKASVNDADDELRDLLPIVSGAALLEKNLPPPAFLVPNMFQRRKANLLMGEDGAGKSFLMLQLAVAVASGTKWLGMDVERGPAVFYTAEEEDRDLDVRLRAVCAHMGVSAAQLNDLHLIPMGGAASSVLGELSGFGGGEKKIQGTKLWRSLMANIATIKPELVIIDPLNEVFDGDELKRTQARQFVGLLRPVAAEYDSTIIVTGHPSVMGVRTGGGTSGSTGWSAVFRSRTYLKKVTLNTTA
jgi:archaellum biogenesis ATPase FlaH